MPRNPFSQPNPQEEQRGDSISRLNRRKILRIIDEDGTAREIEVEGRISMPDGQGGIVVDEYVNYQADSAGNPIPKDLRQLHISHSNLFIPSEKELAICSSRLHPPGVSRNVYVGQDGKLTQSGAICSRCIAWHSYAKLLLVVIGVGALIGLFWGAGIL
jgi:hypothetical protein